MSKYLNKLNELDPTRMYIISVDEYLENEKYYDSLLEASGRDRLFVKTKINAIFNGNTKNKWICALFNTSEYYTWWLVQSYRKPSVDEAFTQMLDYFKTYYEHLLKYLNS
ncbi:hypothetical protein HYO65_gp051 [Tenacibaculum phage PTm1]|uniref:Uncharacterized protein n=2 Tax=Shirahamavirus PTm1 TaxID=2846435 RepID=A0A5S9C0W8_9CAUD|nr:hypothetical protein HYO65_gp051 [Tenacibaculum phage PTm1]BBI90443.1 hypothetical protein [Tenacibaculum phage PTm1]BBI90751.1 hypothetical protein [Tenacibaculum phage PTm5]